MKKWLIGVEMVVEAEDRRKAWKTAEEIVYKALPSSSVRACSELPDPENWQAINEREG